MSKVRTGPPYHHITTEYIDGIGFPWGVANTFLGQWICLLAPDRREKLPAEGPVLSSFRGLCQIENLHMGETLDEMHGFG